MMLDDNHFVDFKRRVAQSMKSIQKHCRQQMQQHGNILKECTIKSLSGRVVNYHRMNGQGSSLEPVRTSNSLPLHPSLLLCFAAAQRNADNFMGVGHRDVAILFSFSHSL